MFYICFKTVLIDRPGNQTEGSASVNRLVIDQTAPILSGIHIESDNSDSTRAKVGDQIKVSFSADEIINGPAVTISDNDATVSNTENFNWVASYIMTDSDAEGNVQFQISSYTDIKEDLGILWPISQILVNSLFLYYFLEPLLY